MFLSFVAPLFITGNLCIAFAQDIQVLADNELPLVGMFTYGPITDWLSRKSSREKRVKT